MRTCFLIIISLFCLQANAQNDSIPHFKNQGEQEDFWAKEKFRKEYKKENYKRYSTRIIALNESTYQYGSLFFTISEPADPIKQLFIAGILYPSLISSPFRSDTLSIGNFNELQFPELSPTVKRFSCWVSIQGFANPIVYMFELTNEQATKQTDLKSFIMGASLTFFKQGNIII